MYSARVSKSACPVKSEPGIDSESTSEVLFGESVLIQESKGEWCKIKTLRDGYEGYVLSTVLELTDTQATHWVCNKATLVFEQADIKSVVVRRLTFGSALVAESFDSNFLALPSGGFIWAAHCLQAGETMTANMIEIGRQHYLNAPYRWGGRSSDGCDCSGLIQMIAIARGIELPRDSADQQAFLKIDIEYNDRQAEDLVFWSGHVGMLESPDMLLHATAHSMRCCFEPLEQVIQRAGSPEAIKRII